MAVYAKRRRTAREYLHLLEASGVDYALLAVALFVPQFLSGASIQQPQVGVILGLVCVVGCGISFAFRRLAGGAPWLMRATWLQFIPVFASVFFLRTFNNSLVDGGLPWSLFPAVYLMLFLIIGSFLVWNDDTVMFMLVPAVSLFGIMSWLETAGTMFGWRLFDVSLVVFMMSLALLMFRLHFRLMFARAQAAGIERPEMLYGALWRSVAGPGLAVLSILAICGLSWLLAPLVQAGVETITGNPTINFQPPQFGQGRISQEQVSMEIGRGPTTASDLPVLRVRVDQGNVRYLRERMYDRYRGRGWAVQINFSEIQASREERPTQISNTQVYRFPARGTVQGDTVRMQAQSVSRVFRYLFSPGVPERLEYKGEVNLSRRDSFVILVRDALHPGEAYYMEGRAPTSDEAVLRSARAPDYQGMRDRYLRVDRYDPQVMRLAQEVTANLDTQYDKVVALKEYIERNCTYNLAAAEIGGEVDRVAAFLFDTREGYCDLFASSLAVLCRTVGIPARVATGYLVDPTSMEGEEYIVRDRHAHIWTEVYFNGVGWVPFDATENAGFVPGAGVGATLQQNLQDGARRMLITIAIVVAAASAVFLLVALMRHRRRLAQVPPQHRAIQRMYVEFIRVMRSMVKRSRAPYETTREYVQATQDKLSDQETIFRLATRFDEALYSPRGPTDELLGEIRTDLDALRRLRAQAK
ncbi:MAG: transglutaminase domain-containing protein [Armatimonadota bacterium]